MKILKKVLGCFCIFECIFCVVLLPDLLPYEKWGMFAVFVCFAMYAYFLLKKSPSNISAIRIWLGVGAVGCCIAMIGNIITPPTEQISITTSIFATILFGVLAFWLLHGFKRRQPVENDIFPKVADIQIEQPVQPTPDPPSLPIEPARPAISVNITHSSVPQETLNAMREAYSPMQADNDMRILQDSLQIIKKTSNLDTFFSRYDIAMQKALTLEQANKASVRIYLPTTPQTIVAYKKRRLQQLLPIIYEKEMQGINGLKTTKGKLNRLDKFLELLNKYAQELEFVPGYNEILDSIATIKQNLN